MNDRFRFRAWLLEYERMVDVAIINFAFRSIRFAQIYLTDDGKPVLNDYGQVIDSVSQSKSREHLSKCILMQCTGLKDKNGRLIYEGDIVLNGLHNNLIEWYKGGFWINGFVNGAKWNIHIIHDSLEVIGNIHENPELLEGDE